MATKDRLPAILSVLALMSVAVPSPAQDCSIVGQNTFVREKLDEFVNVSFIEQVAVLKLESPHRIYFVPQLRIRHHFQPSLSKPLSAPTLALAVFDAS